MAIDISGVAGDLAKAVKRDIKRRDKQEASEAEAKKKKETQGRLKQRALSRARGQTTQGTILGGGVRGMSSILTTSSNPNLLEY